MGLNPDAAGKEFLENCRVLADEFDWTDWDTEGFFVLGDDGDREGLGRLCFDEILDIDHRQEVLLPLDGVVEASVSNPFDGSVGEAPPVEETVRALVWEREEEEMNGRHRNWPSFVLCCCVRAMRLR